MAFLFRFLALKTPSETLKEKNSLLFTVNPFLEGKRTILMESFTLKVYQFPIKITCLHLN